MGVFEKHTHDRLVFQIPCAIHMKDYRHIVTIVCTIKLGDIQQACTVAVPKVARVKRGLSTNVKVPCDAIDICALDINLVDSEDSR